MGSSEGPPRHLPWGLLWHRPQTQVGSCLLQGGCVQGFAGQEVLLQGCF